MCYYACWDANEEKVRNGYDKINNPSKQSLQRLTAGAMEYGVLLDPLYQGCGFIPADGHVITYARRKASAEVTQGTKILSRETKST